MVDLGGEHNLGGLEGVVRGEVDGEEEETAWYGLSGGPMMVACQQNMSSPAGPADSCAGGSRARSCSSLLMRFSAMLSALSYFSSS